MNLKILLGLPNLQEEDIDNLKMTFYGNVGSLLILGTNMVEMLTDIWQEIKKQHSQP